MIGGGTQHRRVEFNLDLLAFDEEDFRSRCHDFDVMEDALVDLREKQRQTQRHRQKERQTDRGTESKRGSKSELSFIIFRCVLASQ